MVARKPVFPTSLDVDLAGLSEAAEPWIARLAVSDQRVQAAAEGRNIRYYQTIGLLDRPSRYEGRVARYSVRHLMQLVAVRAMQAKGLSLAQVQSALTGASSSELRAVVEQALGVEVAEPSKPGSPPAFIAVELAEGVVVTIDSRIHPDFARTANVLRRALAAVDAPNRAHNGELS